MMPTIISALFLTVAVLFGVKSGYASNPLLNFGLLAISAYLLSVSATWLSLPVVFGYIATGVIAGYGGLGAFHETFAGFMFIAESFAIMMLLTLVTSRIVSDTIKAKATLKLLINGAFSSLAIFCILFGLLSLSPLPFKVRIILSLFTATYSPLISHAAGKKSALGTRPESIAAGGFLMSLLLWGLTMALIDPDMPNRLRMSILPLVVTATSFCIGFIWLYFCDRVLFSRIEKRTQWQPFIALLLLYPCFSTVGIDYLIVGIGAGAYLGLISENNYFENSNVSILLIIVFGIFGVRLQLSDLFIIDMNGWKTVAALVAASLLLKTFIPKVINKISPLNSGQKTASLNTVMHGPLAILILYRFLPGFQLPRTGEISIESIRALLAATTLILIIASIPVQLILNKKLKND